MQKYITYSIGILKQTRGNIQKLMDNYSLEECNKIPDGFNNNLVWNYGHVVATQQLLVYGLSGLDLNVENRLVEKYRKGTKPDFPVEQEEYDLLKQLFINLPDSTLADFEAGNFKEYTKYETSFGVTLTSITDAVYFNNIHEVMHLGFMKAIGKFI